VKFLERREFVGDPREVWERASDLEAIPSYWHGTKEISLARSGGETKADLVFAFGGKGKAEISVDEPAMALTLNYVEGPFRGTQTVTVKGSAIEAEWDVTFKGAFKILGPWNASHFRSGTRNALLRLSTGDVAAKARPEAT
jgi:hypothetical protein